MYLLSKYILRDLLNKMNNAAHKASPVKLTATFSHAIKPIKAKKPMKANIHLTHLKPFESLKRSSMQ